MSNFTKLTNCTQIYKKKETLGIYNSKYIVLCTSKIKMFCDFRQINILIFEEKKEYCVKKKP